MSLDSSQHRLPSVTAVHAVFGFNEGEGNMSKLKSNRMGRRGRVRLIAGVTALVSALALAAPAVAGASSTSTTITQNTSMIVYLSPTSSTTLDGTVSWSDVSWSDSYCY